MLFAAYILNYDLYYQHYIRNMVKKRFKNQGWTGHLAYLKDASPALIRADGPKKRIYQFMSCHEQVHYIKEQRQNEMQGGT